ncbi:CAP domain-containing protein [Planomonospora corallina]|uniref:CAP domain-containing protein n=1 Tax=Planomonospora corallina TaxID=1806052 RepID=A0ABV8I9W5_9ACTN
MRRSLGALACLGSLAALSTPALAAGAAEAPAAPAVRPAAPFAAPTPAGGVGTAEENEVVRLTNARRQQGGCRALTHDPYLRRAAYDHSRDMAVNNYFSHTSKDGRTAIDRIRAAGFTGARRWAENIAWGQRTPSAVVTAWMNSSGHRANIMNCAYTHIGVGMAKKSDGTPYWTQNFAARQ